VSHALHEITDRCFRSWVLPRPRPVDVAGRAALEDEASIARRILLPQTLEVVRGQLGRVYCATKVDIDHFEIWLRWDLIRIFFYHDAVICSSETGVRNDDVNLLLRRRSDGRLEEIQLLQPYANVADDAYSALLAQLGGNGLGCIGVDVPDRHKSSVGESQPLALHPLNRKLSVLTRLQQMLVRMPCPALSQLTSVSAKSFLV